MSFRFTHLAAALIASPCLAPNPASAQAPAAANPKLAAYAGHTCTHTYTNGNGVTVWDEFSIRGGNVVTHHHSRTPKAVQDAGVIAPQPAGDGTYRFRVQSGSVYVLHPHDTPDAMTVTVTDGYGRGTSTVTFSCK